MNRSTPTTKATDCRERLIEATVAETVEAGYTALSVARIVSRAGASRASFYARFANKKTAVEAAYERLFECFLDRLQRACGAQADWPSKIRVGIGITLDMVAASPTEAQFVLVEALAVDDNFHRQVLDSRDRLARLLFAGRSESPHGRELPDVIESALVGGIGGVILGQLRDGDARHLPALAPELAEFALAPYLGREAAAKVARRQRPRLGDR